MSGFRFLALAVVLMATRMGAQTPGDSGDVRRLGPGVTPPRALRRVAPKYSPEAQKAGIEGAVVLQIVINEMGRIIEITTLRSLGFGLDEQAQAAVREWEFAPAMQGDAPVKVLVTVEVNFRLWGPPRDDQAERQRTEFALAAQTAKRGGASPAEVDEAVQTMLELCRQKFPPAMYVTGMWKTSGEHVAKDAAHGFELIQKAAAKEYGPALYEVAIRRMQGRDLPLDAEKGMHEMRSAATLGSQQAQFYLGNRYETGDGVPLEPERARRYYRLCATSGVALCQYRLGRMLYKAPDRRERDYLQAIALFQLAAEQGLTEAKELAPMETDKLTAEQRAWVGKLKGQIVRK